MNAIVGAALLWVVPSAEARLLENIQPPGKHRLLFKARAEGVQHFRKFPSMWTGGRTSYWGGAGQRAEILNELGEKIGVVRDDVFEANDGSRFEVRREGWVPAADAKAIPWLLLKGDKHEGKGIFSRVQYVQRVDTWAGNAWRLHKTADKKGEVRFQATYVFYGEIAEPERDKPAR